MLLTVLTPVKELLQVRDVARVQVQLADSGGLGIYPGHAPLLAETVAAPLRYLVDDEEHALELDAGILHVLGHDEVVLYVPGELSETANSQANPAEELRFERLAQTLLTTLDGQTAPVATKERDEAA
ncbi:MAG: hypothetical protein U9Q70_01320 [Chloroflexota bacterium]|nr:hypothetical protein [Chloroflexota bacterium]